MLVLNVPLNRKTAILSPLPRPVSAAVGAGGGGEATAARGKRSLFEDETGFPTLRHIKINIDSTREDPSLAGGSAHFLPEGRSTAVIPLVDARGRRGGAGVLR